MDLAVQPMDGTKVPANATLQRTLDGERLRKLPDRLTHHVHILEMNGDSYRLKRSRENAPSQAPDEPEDSQLTTVLFPLPSFAVPPSPRMLFP